MTTQPARRRADAERNIAAILTAAAELFGRGATPSMGEVAAAAGVRRATLYAHFPSREELLDAVTAHMIAETDAELTALHLDRDPPDVALTRLVRTSWPILDRHRRLRALATTELGPERLREHHRALHHVDHLIRRASGTAPSAPTSPSTGWSPRSTPSSTPPPTRPTPAASTRQTPPTCSPRLSSHCSGANRHDRYRDRRRRRDRRPHGGPRVAAYRMAG